MNLLFSNIKGIIFFIILLSIVGIFDDSIFMLFDLNGGVWERFFSIIIPVLNIIFVIRLAFMFKKLIRRSRDQERQYRQLLDLSPEAIFVHRKGIVIYTNQAGTTLLGYHEQAEILNRPWKEIMNARSYDSLQSSSKKHKVDQQFKNHYLKIYRPDGKIVIVEAKSTHIEFDGQPAREVIARDITAQENRRNMLAQFSYLDALTGLTNRRSLMDRLNQKIEEAKRNNTVFSLMFIDLDGFKQVNDTLGHDGGDLLLKQVSNYLKQCVSEKDVVARYGGDEFIILLPDADQQDCVPIAKSIIEHNHLPSAITNEKVQVTASIGIAQYPKNGEDAETLIKYADMAMYQAKKLGKNNYQF